MEDEKDREKSGGNVERKALCVTKEHDEDTGNDEVRMANNDEVRAKNNDEAWAVNNLDPGSFPWPSW